MDMLSVLLLSVLLPQCWESVTSTGLSILSPRGSVGGWRAGRGLGQGRNPTLPGPGFLPAHTDIWAQEGALPSDECAMPLTAPSTTQFPGNRRGQFCALLSQLT